MDEYGGLTDLQKAIQRLTQRTRAPPTPPRPYLRENNSK